MARKLYKMKLSKITKEPISTNPLSRFMKVADGKII